MEICGDYHIIFYSAQTNIKHQKYKKNYKNSQLAMMQNIAGGSISINK